MINDAEFLQKLSKMYKWFLAHKNDPEVSNGLSKMSSKLLDELMADKDMISSRESNKNLLFLFALLQTTTDLCRDLYWGAYEHRKEWRKKLLVDNNAFADQYIDEAQFFDDILKFADWGTDHAHGGDPAREKCVELYGRLGMKHFGSRPPREKPHGDLLFALMLKVYEVVFDGIQDE